MIPSNGCHPEINVLFIGGYVLEQIRSEKRLGINVLFEKGVSELKISVDHMMLALDWLYIISAINIDNNEITLNEAR